MQIVRTFNSDFIADVYSAMWHLVTDDEGAKQTLFFPDVSLNHYWLKVNDVGLFYARPMNEICYEAHIVFKPGTLSVAHAAAPECLNWMWKYTDCQRLIGCIPSFNKFALQVAKDSGFKVFGINQKSFKKNGKLWDQVYLGISRG